MTAPKIEKEQSMCTMLNVRLSDEDVARLDRNASSAAFGGSRSRYTRLALRWFHRQVESESGAEFVMTVVTEREPAKDEVAA